MKFVALVCVIVAETLGGCADVFLDIAEWIARMYAHRDY